MNGLCDTHLEVLITTKFNRFSPPQMGFLRPLIFGVCSLDHTLAVFCGYCLVSGMGTTVFQPLCWTSPRGIYILWSAHYGRLQLTALWCCSYNFAHDKHSVCIVSDSLPSRGLEMLWQRDEDPEHFSSQPKNRYFMVGTNTHDCLTQIPKSAQFSSLSLSWKNQYLWWRKVNVSVYSIE